DVDIVPRTADNFLSLCEKGYYNNVEFHRIVSGFMMQGGDPTGTGRGGESIWGKPFLDEFDSRLRHTERGLLSMANSGPNTNNSQFFITFKECTYLDNKHSIFGRVVGGIDILDEIEVVSTDKQDRPYDRIVIRSVEVFENPFKQYDAALELGTTVEELKRKNEAPKVKGTVIKVGNDWVAYDGVVDVKVPNLDVSAST
ncbi:peptidylprolyl isomerase, partial [Thraustotheca clavata]